MTTISSHVLNAVDGTHAAGVRVECFRLGDDDRAEPVFSVISVDGNTRSGEISTLPLP